MNPFPKEKQLFNIIDDHLETLEESKRYVSELRAQDVSDVYLKLISKERYGLKKRVKGNWKKIMERVLSELRESETIEGRFETSKDYLVLLKDLPSPYSLKDTWAWIVRLVVPKYASNRNNGIDALVFICLMRVLEGRNMKESEVQRTEFRKYARLFGEKSHSFWSSAGIGFDETSDSEELFDASTVEVRDHVEE